jgi:hypothetical protein
MTDFLDITPATEYLAWLRAKNHRFAIIFGELIDNAFDADAKRIEIEVTGRRGGGDIIVSDDGRGCSDLSVMLAPGKREQHFGTKLGRFGIGAKDAAIWLWGTTNIQSVRDGVLRSVVADWDSIMRSGKWRVNVPSEETAHPGRRGTRISFINTIRRFPDGKQFDELVSELGYLYAPAIKQGMQIAIRGKGRQQVLVPRFEMPSLVDVVDVDITVGGKRAHVHVGVVPDGVKNPRPGISYTHGFRVIIQASGLGCGGKAYQRVCGWVRLDGKDWKLTTNKDALDHDEDEIGDAVYAVVSGVVDRAAKQAMSAKSSALAGRLTAALRGLVGEGDAKRDRGDKHGRVDPTGNGGKHKRAKNARSGDSRRTVNVGSMSVDFKECDEPAIGSVDDRGKIIWLAENHPWIQHLRDTENIDALMTSAMALLGGTEQDTQTRFVWAKRDGEMTFDKAVGALLRDQRSLRVVP